MVNVIQRIGKGAIMEILEQTIGGLAMQQEQNQLIISQLQARAEKAETELANLKADLKGVPIPDESSKANG